MPRPPALLTAAAEVGLERLAAVDADTFQSSKAGKVLDEIVRKAAEHRAARWL